MHWRRQLWGTRARALLLVLDFQLFNLSGHFRVTQTLDIGLYVVAYSEQMYRPVALSLFIV